MQRDYDTQVRVKMNFAHSEYRQGLEVFRRDHSRVTRANNFSLGKFQMSVLHPPVGWASHPENFGVVRCSAFFTSQDLERQRDDNCPEGWHGGYKHKQLMYGGCSGCRQRRIDKQVNHLSEFWDRMRTVGQAMALSGELDVVTDGEIDDKKVVDLYHTLLSHCLEQEVPAYRILGGPWGQDGHGHIFSDSSFPNWGAHEPPVVVDVWSLTPAVVELQQMGRD
jgi:hypothetical protein